MNELLDGGRVGVPLEVAVHSDPDEEEATSRNEKVKLHLEIERFSDVWKINDNVERHRKKYKEKKLMKCYFVKQICLEKTVK